MSAPRPPRRLAAALLGLALSAMGGPAVAAGAPPATPTATAPTVAAAASSATGAQPASKIIDNDPDSYWQSSGPAFPQWAQVDLGKVTRFGGVLMKVPAAWASRTETLAVQGSNDGKTFNTIVESTAYTFDPKSDNTVRVDFGTVLSRYARVEITGNSAGPQAQLSDLEVVPAAVAATNLAAGRTMTASGYVQNYVPANANDGNQDSYWESTNNAWPQWLQVDLGASVSSTQIVLKLPTANWGARTETLSVQGSTDGGNFAQVVASAGYTFDPASSNTVTINYTPLTTRYLRLNFTGNTGWPAGQVSEFEVYGPATGDTQPPSAPGNLAYTQPAAGQIRLTWSAATDNVGVTGYDVYANNALRTSVSGTTLTYTDSQPDTATVTYFVRAHDAAGNQSGNSNSVTRTGSGGGNPGTNLALGKPITASSTQLNFVAANADDNDTGTYWEGAGGTYPQTLTVQLGSNVDTSSVVVKLNPASIWGPRTQTIEVLGREQSASGFTSLTPATTYSFDPATGNTVTVPVSARVADVQLKFTANSGAGGGQAAEFQVIGVPAPNPDLTITGSSWSPASPVETDSVTASATVRNAGTLPAGATDVNFYLGTTKVGTAPVGALAAGASSTVSASIGALTAGSYQLTAKVDESNKVIEQNEANNSYTNPTALVVTPVQSSDLVATTNWTPGNPSAGNPVAFSVTLKNQGTVASASGAHGITVKVADAASGSTVATLTGSYNGVINAGATAAPVNVGNWAAANGNYTVTTTVANDANELPVKQGNNTSTANLFVGRGANMPYDSYEAESGVLAGGASILGPNRTIGDYAGEASGRQAVALTQTGASVEFTTREATNTLVTRFAIPDGTTSTLDIYVDGTLLKPISLTSQYAWLYGAEASPTNDPSAGSPRHVYDEANVMLGTTVPAGHKIRLQKDAANGGNFWIDFVNLELATAQPNPDPAHYATPAGFTQQDVQAAFDKVRQDSTLTGVYLPVGDYQVSSKMTIYGKAVAVVGAGPWFTRFDAPSGQTNSDVGIDIQSSANGSRLSGFAFFGNYTSRQDGPGKVFNLAGVADVTLDNIWVEHMMCMFWGQNVQNITISDSRIRDTFADGVNMTNGSSGNHIVNDEARSTGDDSFAMFAATDAGGGNETGNVFENLSALLTWRAAGFAVYGGEDNAFRNLYVADTLTYAGITVSSLNFGYPMRDFGPDPTTIQNASIVRAGGHFWGQQTFPGIWLFSANQKFQGIRVSDVDITDPTYSGIMFQTDYVGGAPLQPITDTVLANVSISGARQSGDALNAKSGFGIWANELPESGQGPAVGSATFTNLKLSDNYIDIRNTTSTFTITRN